ncbi:MAG: YncE family protein [Rhizobiales bacterium]|nr:YncE family protein [Hyphomicrobiales bacterium]
MRRHLIGLALTLLVSTGAWAQGNFIIIANDEKTFFEAGGPRNGAPGKDSVSIVDISQPLAPRIVANLPLMNSVFGPPTNLQITPDGRLGLVANPVVMNQDGANWRPAPDDKLHVIDLAATPPRLVETITVGRQPSGLAISRKGDLALVANRNGKSVSVLTIAGGTVRQIAEILMDDEVCAVAITPDGRRAFVAKNAAHKIAVLAIDGTTVTYDKTQDMVVGYGVYNVEVTPDGRHALAANTGIGGDGHADTVSVIDARANPPRVLDHVTVGDGPEGFAIAPNGRHAVAVLLKGSAAVHSAWSYSRNGSVRLIRIGANGRLTPLNEVPAGALPEGVAFSPDSRYLYVGNYVDRSLQVYRINGDRLVDTGVKLALPGQPAAIRGRP